MCTTIDLTRFKVRLEHICAGVSGNGYPYRDSLHIADFLLSLLMRPDPMNTKRNCASSILSRTHGTGHRYTEQNLESGRLPVVSGAG